MTATRARSPKALSIDGVRYPIIDDLGYQWRLGVYAKMIEVDGEDRLAYRRRGESEWRIWRRPGHDEDEEPLTEEEILNQDETEGE